MEESEVSSSENVKIDEVELRKNFSLYVENIRFELQRYGVQITHSDILGYIMEKLTGNFVTKIQNEKEQNVPINASEDEISRYIIGRKYPYMYRFEEENTELNRFQKFFRSSRLNSLSDQNTLMILRLSRAFNFIFLAIAIFLGTQSLFSIYTIFTSPEELSTSLKILDGSIIFGYQLFWTPQVFLFMNGLFLVDIIQTYIVLNIPTLTRIKPEMNQYYNKAILRMKTTILMGFAYTLYIIIGSIIIIQEDRINGLDPISDLGIPFVFLMISFLLWGLMFILFTKERLDNNNYERSKIKLRSIFYILNVLVILFTVIIMIFLSLFILRDATNAIEITPNSRSIDYDLTVLNFVALVSLSFYTLISIISSFINSSTDKSNWIKFYSNQIVFQTAIVAFYALIEVWIIFRFNQFMEANNGRLKLSFQDLFQGLIRYFVASLLAFGFLKISK